MTDPICLSSQPRNNKCSPCRIISTLYLLPHNHEKKTSENIVGKGENTGNQHFLLFPQCFLPFSKQISNFQFTLILSSAIAFNFDQSIILSFGKALN